MTDLWAKITVGVGVVSAIILLYLAATPLARADVRISKGPFGFVVRLLDEPCAIEQGKVLGDGAKAAKGTFPSVVRTPFGFVPTGKITDMQGCWVVVPGKPAYRTVWEDGDEAVYPFDDFTPEGV